RSWLFLPRPLAHQRTDALPQGDALGVLDREGGRFRPSYMHGGGGAFDRQRQPVIELLEFGNLVTVAHSLAHGIDYSTHIRSKKARREGTLTEPSEKPWRYMEIPTPHSLRLYSANAARHGQSV